MAVERDPYQVLGLPRSASLDDVKRAYRGLAKANHPDAAGEAALPQFLAIQAAYEQIAGSGPVRPGQARPASRPLGADPDRAGATIERMALVVAGLGPALHPVAFPGVDGRQERMGRPGRGMRVPGPGTVQLPGPSACRGSEPLDGHRLDKAGPRAARRGHLRREAARRAVQKLDRGGAEPRATGTAGGGTPRAARRLTPTRSARSVSR